MAWGTPASLGVASGSSAHSVTLSGVSVSAGDLIVVCIAYRAKAYTDAILVSDSAGNSYTVHKQQYSTTNVFGVAVAYAVATSALSSGGITVFDTATGSNNFTNAVFAAYSISGGATSSPEDTSVLVSTVGGEQFPSGMNLTSGTPTQAGDLLIGLFNSTGLSSFTESASWTTLIDRQQGSGFTNTKISASYYVNSGSGAVTWNPTSGGSGAYVPIIIGFKIASAGGSGVTVEAVSGSLAIIGQTGDVSATANKTARAAFGSLSIVGQIGHVAANANISVEAVPGAIGIAGSVPAVHATANRSIKATAGSVSIIGAVPAVRALANQNIAANAGSISIEGQIAVVAGGSGKTAAAAAGSLSVIGSQCTVGATANIAANANTGVVSIIGRAGRVVASSFVEVRGASGGVKIIGSVGIAFALTPTSIALERVVSVYGEARSALVPSENRLATVLAENREVMASSSGRIAA